MPSKVEKAPAYAGVEEPEEFEACEAVALRDYLGKYDLVRVV